MSVPPVIGSFMARYVKRMVRRRKFVQSAVDFWSNEDHQKDANWEAENNGLTEDQIAEARVQYYQENLVDEMLKILYLERFSI